MVLSIHALTQRENKWCLTQRDMEVAWVERALREKKLYIKSLESFHCHVSLDAMSSEWVKRRRRSTPWISLEILWQNKWILPFQSRVVVRSSRMRASFVAFSTTHFLLLIPVDNTFLWQPYPHLFYGRQVMILRVINFIYHSCLEYMSRRVILGSFYFYKTM